MPNARIEWSSQPGDHHSTECSGMRENPMSSWKVIALGNDEIEAVSGFAAQDRPRADEWMIWQGIATDKGDALQRAEKADPRIDLEWMRVRPARDLNAR